MDHSSHLLATIRYYSENPVSLYSVLITGICLLLAYLLAAKQSRHDASRQWFAVIASLFAILFLVVQGSSRYPDTDGIVSLAVCLAFGFGYSMSAMRGPSRLAGIYAVLLSTIFLFCIVLGFIAHLNRVLSEYEPEPVIGADLAMALQTLSLIPWLAFCWWRVPRYRQQSVHTRNAAKGQCVSCGYNLRGSKDSPTCPECGHAIDWEQITIADAPLKDES